MQVPSRISAVELTDKRLDAEYYEKSYRINARLISQFGRTTNLENIRSAKAPIRRGIDMPKFVEFYDAPVIVTISAFEEPNVNFSKLQKIDIQQHSKFKGSQLKAGDLLIAMGGYAGKSAICPSDTPLANIGRHTARIVIDPQKANKYYIWSFISSSVGRLQFSREITGSVQAGINIEDLREILISTPAIEVQTYIGDKVRQAERLRDRSRELDITAKDKVSEYFDHFKASPRRKIYNTEAQCITGRIDSWSYNPRFLEAVAAIKNSGSTLIDLEKITQKITTGATPKGAMFSNQGIPWIRGKDFSNGDIINESLPMMDIHSESTMKRSRLEYGDLLLSIKGTVGDVAVVDESLVGFNINQDVARIQLGSIEEAHFLALFLESSLGQVLIEQQVYGAINPFFSLENLRAFLVPDPNSIDQVYKSLVVGLRSKSVIYRRFSKCLTIAAKLLVEALIEGKISEADLKAAQEGLEKGDTTLDREILARLARKGIDRSHETPLFPDLDALYAVLASLDVTETTEESYSLKSRASNVYHLHRPPLDLASEADKAAYQTTTEVPE